MEPAPYRQLQKSFTAKLKLETKVNLEWKNINYHMMIKNPKSTPFNSLYDHKHILDGINGSALAGEMIAIMGPTGCGKTSLLNVLAARAPYGSKQDTKLDGQIFVNGEPRDDASFRALSAYVLQDDRLFPHLTVFETLTIASHFYLPTNMPDGEKAELVTAIIAELGLVKAKDTIIGDEKVRGVSGGERRRASIAVQMISNPTVLFLDEPTSGLDSFQAQSVMEAMKSIAMNNRLVISVIHQPRSSIYNMFDRLLLLSEGKQMYFGPAADAVTYFIKAGYPCPARFNPSDFFLDILSPDNRSPELEEQSNKRINNFSELYKGKHPIEFTSIADKPFTLPKSGAWKMPDIKRIVRNFRFLAWRSFTEQMRDLPTILIRFFTSCFFGLIIGAVYSNTKHDQQGIQNITGLLFLITLNQAFNNLFTALNVFPKEKLIVYRERSANAYDTSSYFISKFIVEMPLNVLPSLVFGIIIYWLAHLNPDPSVFGEFLGIMILHSLASMTLGLAVSAISPSTEAAIALGAPIVIIMLLFGGFYINIDSLPIVANLIPYIAYLKWTFEAFCVNEFVGETFKCKGAVCQSTGAEVLSGLSFGGQTTSGPAVFGLAMCFIGFLVIVITMLEFSRITYMPLGYEGSRFARSLKKYEKVTVVKMEDDHKQIV